MNLLPIDRDVLRRLDAELDVMGVDRDDGHSDVTSDDDGLTEAPGQNQHERLL